MKSGNKTRKQIIKELEEAPQRVEEHKDEESMIWWAEDQLRMREEKYRHIFENIQDIYYEIGVDGIILELSPSVEKLTKYKRIELIGKSVYKIYVDREEREEFLKVIKETGIVTDFEVTMKDKDGQLLIVSLCSRLVLDETGDPYKIVGTMRDITKRKHAEEALRESEERFRSVIDNIGIGISLISPNMEILTLNNQMKKWFPDIDISKRPICYKAFNNPPRETVCSYCPTCKTLQDGNVHESVTETPADSEIRNYRIISSPIKSKKGEIVAAIEMVEDITENKKAQEALKESENKYRTIFETTGAATVIIEEDTIISLINTEFEKQSGYSKGDVEGKKSWTEFLVKDDLTRMQEYHRLRRVDPEAVPRNYEFQFVDRNGHIRDIFTTVAMIPGTMKTVASLLDVTGHKRMEEELKKERETFFTVLKNYPHGVALVDRNGINQYVNPEFTKITGYTIEDIPTGRDWFQKAYPVPEYRKKVIDAWKADKAKTGIGLDRHFSITCKNGPVKEIEFRTTFLENWSITVLNDITDRKRAEEALKKRESELDVKSRNLEEMNTALRVLLNQREKDKDELEENVLSNVKQLIMPYIEKLRKSHIEAKEADYVSILETNLKDIVSPFSSKLSTKYLNLTPKEIQIANLIKEGKTTKEIAELLNISPGTIEFHRNNIRIKLGLKNKKANMRSHLLTLS